MEREEATSGLLFDAQLRIELMVSPSEEGLLEVALLVPCACRRSLVIEERPLSDFRSGVLGDTEAEGEVV